MQGGSNSDSEDAAVVAARAFRVTVQDDDPSPDDDPSAWNPRRPELFRGYDEVIRESNERWLDASERWLDLIASGPPQEGENGSDTTRASGGDGGRDDVAPPGVGHSSCAKGVGKDKSKVHDGIWMSDLSRSSHIMQPLDTNCRQELRQQWATMVDNGRSPEALQRRQEALRGPQKTIEAWKRRFGKRPRWDTEASERQTRIRTTNQPAAVTAK